MAAKYEIEKSDENNFLLWKMKTRVILRKNNYLAAIGERPMEITDDDKWNEMDGNVIANLHLALANVVLSRVNAPLKRAEEKRRRNKQKRKKKKKKDRRKKRCRAEEGKEKKN